MTVYIHLDINLITMVFINIILGFLTCVFFFSSYNELNKEVYGKKLDLIYFTFGMEFLIILVTFNLTSLNIISFN